MKKVLRIIGMVLGYFFLYTGLGGLYLSLTAIGGNLATAALAIPLGIVLRYLSLLEKKPNIRLLAIIRDIALISIYWTGSVVTMLMYYPGLTQNALIRLIILILSIVVVMVSLKKLGDEKIRAS